MKRKNFLFLTFFLVPVLFSCVQGEAPSGNNNPSKSPASVESVKTPAAQASSPVTTNTATPAPAASAEITALPTASATPVPSPTPSNLPVDPDNSTGIYELRSHITGDAETYLAICDKGLYIVARQSGSKFTQDVSFNEITDFTGSKTKSEVINKGFIASIKSEYKNENSPELNSTYEWIYNYRDGKMYDISLIIKNIGSSDHKLDYDPVLLSNTFNKMDNKGNFVEVCNNLVVPEAEKMILP